MQDIEKIENDLKSQKKERYRLLQKQPAIFLDRDGVINEERSFIKTPEELVMHSFSGPAIQQLNAAGFLVIVVTNQSGIARGYYTESILATIHNKMKDILAKDHAYCDAIYYCPHHPNATVTDKTYIQVCDCRKPKPGMIEQACNDFSIDLSNSFLVGDSERDIQCGKAAGVYTIGVNTGNGVRGKTKADQQVEDLLAATNFILDIKHRLNSAKK